jgi:predicted RNA binding protein YcfA (HicA-like mRNA interferase family)
MKVRELIKTLESEEWVHVRTKGSHRQFRHHKKKRTVTIAGKMGADIPPGTLASILKATGLK